MYLQVLSSAMGTSSGTEKCRRHEDFNFKMIIEELKVYICEAEKFKIEE